jgi:hypothetical protein
MDLDSQDVSGLFKIACAELVEVIHIEFEYCGPDWSACYDELACFNRRGRFFHSGALSAETAPQILLEGSADCREGQSADCREG